MKDFLKNKILTGLIVVATVVLAGIAIFTAFRLYQLRSTSVAPTAPESFPEAASGWAECRLGEPTHNVEACRKKAENYKGIPGPAGQNDQAWYDWAQSPPKPLSGDTTCGLAPTVCVQTQSCSALTFNLSGPSVTLTATPTSTPTSTPTATLTPTATATPTPTDPPIGGPSSTPTGTPTPTVSPTSGPTGTVTSTPTATLTPTPGGDTLPDAGVGLPTIAMAAFGFLIILFAFALAL